MPDRYLKHRKSGQIYIRRDDWAADDEFYEVADVQGTELTDAQKASFASMDNALEEAAAFSKSTLINADIMLSDEDMALGAHDSGALAQQVAKGMP